MEQSKGRRVGVSIARRAYSVHLIDKNGVLRYTLGMFTPRQVSENYIPIAKAKTQSAWYKLFILAVLAGVFIAFGAAAATVCGADFTGSAASLVKAAVFPVGLILVTVCGAELFTGNCLLVAPAINKDIKVSGLLKNWGLAYAGNLVGGVLIAVIVVYSHVMSGTVADAAVATAAAKCGINFGEALLRGIACNMLVCLAVLAAMSAKSTVGKIAALYMPVFAFVACGFEHSVANMYYLSAGLMTGAEYGLTAAALNIGNSVVCLLASTLGNIIGGAAIAVAYYFAVGRNKTAAVTGAAASDNIEPLQEQTAEAASAADENSGE